MDLADVQAALAELTRREKSLIRQWKHRLALMERYKGEAYELARTLDGVQDQIQGLVVKEREMKGEE